MTIARGRLNLSIFTKNRTVTSKTCLMKPDHALGGSSFLVKLLVLFVMSPGAPTDSVVSFLEMSGDSNSCPLTLGPVCGFLLHRNCQLFVPHDAQWALDLPGLALILSLLEL